MRNVVMYLKFMFLKRKGGGCGVDIFNKLIINVRISLIFILTPFLALVIITL